MVGGLAVSAAGCIANDLWDQRIDAQVERTTQRPLARGAIRPASAIRLLLILLVVSLVVVLTLPRNSLLLCFCLAVLALPPILLYPSAKRWFAYPQLVLGICWGFAVLIPWAAQEGGLTDLPTLLFCWLGTLTWTFGFDTVYAMADRPDDRKLGLRSSALTLGTAVVPVVELSYVITLLSLAAAAISAGTGWGFWPFWLIAGLGMVREARQLQPLSHTSMAVYGRHFKHQVWLGALLLLGLMVGGG